MRSSKEQVLAQYMCAGVFICIAVGISPAGTLLFPCQDTSLSYRDRAFDLVSRMTVTEKICQTRNFADPVSRLSLPEYIYQLEGLHGIMYFWNKTIGPVTVFPQIIALGSTWDTSLICQCAAAISDEARAYRNAGWGGLNYYAPTINLARDPRWGRTEETASEDPYLLTQFTLAWVKGFQGTDPKYYKATTTLKHYACNNSEENRTSGSAAVDERDMNEYYLPPFRAGIEKANSRSIMTTYNAVNDTPSVMSRYLLQKKLRGSWSFDGFSATDANGVSRLWTTYHFFDPTTGKAAAGACCMLNGLDMSLDPKPDWDLPNAITQKYITEADIDIAARRILETRYLYGDFDPVGACPFDNIPFSASNSQAMHAVARKAAQEAIILLKNSSNLLPLNKNTVQSIAVIGPAADTCYWLGGYTTKNPAYKISPLAGIKSKLSSNAIMTYAKGADYYDACADSFINNAVGIARTAGVVILCLGTNWRFSREGFDAANLNLPGRQTELAQKVHAVNPNTIVVLSFGNPVSINWINDSIPAILGIGYGGQEYGNAIADALFGDYNPGGKVAQTFYKNSAQLPSILNEYHIVGKWLYMYCTADVLYPFGYGLSYTTFAYSNCVIGKSTIASYEDMSVSVDVQNTGTRSGDEVVQLYLSKAQAGPVTLPKKALKGFKRITLAPGETRTVTFPLNGMDAAYYDIPTSRFMVSPGLYNLLIGSSSVDIRQQGAVTINWVEPQYADGYYKIVNRKSGFALQFPDNFGKNGSPAFQGSYYGYNNQKWTIFQATANNYKFVNRKTGRVLDAGGTVDGPVHEQDYNGSAGQLFSIANVGGFASITSSQNGKALEAANGSMAEGARIQTATVSSDAPQQQWQIIKVYDEARVVLPPSAFTESKVSLISLSNNRYVGSKIHNFMLAPGSVSCGADEICYLYTFGDGSVALKGGFNVKYVGVDPTDRILYANKESVDISTLFTTTVQSDSTIALKSKLNGKYVTVGSWGNGLALMATADAVGTGEKFRKMPGVNNDTVPSGSTAYKGGGVMPPGRRYVPGIRVLPCGIIRYTAPAAGQLEFALFDSKGRIISRFTKATNQGSFVITGWKLTDVAPGGMYFVAMKMAGATLAMSRAIVF
jgi:beta-glucosidase